MFSQYIYMIYPFSLTRLSEFERLFTHLIILKKIFQTENKVYTKAMQMHLKLSLYSNEPYNCRVK